MTFVPFTGPDQPASSAIRLQRALNSAQLGLWQYDPLRCVFSWDARSREIIGTAANEVTVEQLMDWVHPEDAEKVWAAFHAVLDPAEPVRSATEFRLRRGDSETCWVKTFGLTYFEGSPTE